jgi:hypothetical protein
MQTTYTARSNTWKKVPKFCSEEQNANLAQLKYPNNYYHGKQQTDLTSDNGRRITLEKFLSL